MKSYLLERSGLELTETSLIKRNKKGVITVELDVARIQGAAPKVIYEPVAFGVVLVIAGLATAAKLFIPSAVWSWTLVISAGCISLFFALGVRQTFIVVELGGDRVKFHGLGGAERVDAFIAMINQAAEKKRANQALLPTPISVTPAASAPVAPDTGAADL